ncbi:hypothetical protein C2S52_009604 [Perilla frutescens var. hirtella]|nr:hypothetical protein C2S52_009604 [Perilla frutescens var. hirtella]
MECHLFSTTKIVTIIWPSIILLSILNLPPILCIPKNPYNRCGAPFNCGKLAGIGFPFWGGNRPAECGYAALKLGCENGTTTTILINDVNYRVLAVNKETKTLKITRNDLLPSLCPRQLVNTTLDPRVFEYATSYVNLTFLYGCPAVDFPVPYQFECAVKGIKEKIGYVEFGSQLSGMCHASVVVPVSYASFFNFKDLEALIGEGFEVQFTVDSGGCADCERSGGRCGYDDAGKKFVCFCSDSAAESTICGDGAADYADAPQPPTVADVGKQGPQAVTVVAPSVSGGDGNNNLGMNIGLPIGGAVLAGVGLGWLIFYCKQKRKQRLQRLATESTQTESKEVFSPLSSKHPSSTSPSAGFTKSIPSYPSSNSDLGRGSTYFGVQVFSYTELEAATDNFNPSRELGDGGFGTVYYGVLTDGRIVAVKRLYENNFKRVEQFMNEVEILTKLRHANLVTLFGCTSKRSRELLLVYEYISNGTVADHLHGKRASSGLLSWSVRLNIAIETAEALAYLHKSDIIHRDVKTNNILLDNDFHVKVADFGLSRLFPTDATHVSTAPQGTPGYVDPEYYQCYQLTEKSDVYSFGVVLIELISSLQAVDTNRHRHDINLANMAVNKIQNHTLHELVDSTIGFETNSTVRRMATLVAELAFRCLQQERDMRPSMEETLEALKGIKNEDLNAHKVEIVDILVDEETGPLKGGIAPPSPDSVAATSSTPHSSA